MNILILNWRDPKHPLAGGAEISLQKHAQYWIKNGANVTWFASKFKKSKKIELVDSVRIIRRGSHYTVALWFFLYYLKNKLKEFDVVIDCFHFIPFFTPLYIKDKQIIALINEVAGNVWFENIFLPFSFIGYKLEPYIIRLYKKIPFITGSKSAMEDLMNVGISKNKINVINHGISDLEFEGKIPLKEQRPTLLFLGRLSKDKGIEDALLMLELLIRDNPEIILWVVGKFESRDYERRVRNLINEFKVKKNCIFYGYVDESTKAELLARAWILVHPSSKEGWGLNVIEANSVGTPAVGYNVAGLRDSIVDDKTGMLVESDAISLADAVEMLIEKKEKLQKLSENSRLWAKEFNWEKSGKESYDLIGNIFNNRNHNFKP